MLQFGNVSSTGLEKFIENVLKEGIDGMEEVRDSYDNFAENGEVEGMYNSIVDRHKKEVKDLKADLELTEKNIERLQKEINSEYVIKNELTDAISRLEEAIQIHEEKNKIRNEVVGKTVRFNIKNPDGLDMFADKKIESIEEFDSIMIKYKVKDYQILDVKSGKGGVSHE